MISGLFGHPTRGAVEFVPPTFGGRFAAALMAYSALHCLLLPSTTVLFRDYLLRDPGAPPLASTPIWRPTLGWAVSSGAIAGLACWLMLGTRQQFIYFQF